MVENYCGKSVSWKIVAKGSWTGLYDGYCNLRIAVRFYVAMAFPACDARISGLAFIPQSCISTYIL